MSAVKIFHFQTMISKNNEIHPPSSGFPEITKSVTFNEFVPDRLSFTLPLVSFFNSNVLYMLYTVCRV